MGTSTVRTLNDEEMTRLPAARQAMEETSKAGTSSRFNFFAAFDGTNNDKDNLKLSGDPFPTNVANLQKQARDTESATFRSGYYPGVGTGGDQGNLVNAGINPTPAIDAAAQKAYGQFVEASRTYLKAQPDATPADLSASVTGFSRGCTSAVRFAQLVNEHGLVAPDGTVVAKPGSVPITAMALMDPVATGVQGELAVPPNVKGQVLVVQAEHENRSWFRPLDYSDDPRVITVRHPGNHVGVGGGYDRNGSAANVHEGITAYFQRRGLPLADVPPEQRHDPSQRPWLRTEAYQTARNGDVLTEDNGKPKARWPLDDADQPRRQVKPPLSEQHKAWLRQAYTELAPTLKSAGLSPEQCLQVSAACVASAAGHGDWGPPQRFLVSKDGARVAVQHQDGRFDELRVGDSLRTSTQSHLDGAQAARDGAPSPSQERTAPVRGEQAIAR